MINWQYIIVRILAVNKTCYNVLRVCSTIHSRNFTSPSLLKLSKLVWAYGINQVFFVAWITHSNIRISTQLITALISTLCETGDLNHVQEGKTRRVSKSCQKSRFSIIILLCFQLSKANLRPFVSWKYILGHVYSSYLE